MPVGKGGAEINFPIGDAAQNIGKQTTGGPFSAPVLRDANQFSYAFNQGQTPLTTSMQQICEKINNAMHVDSNMKKAYSDSENLGNPSFNANNKIADKNFNGFSITSR